MSRIVVSGASGDLGRRVTEQLLEAHHDAELTLVTRSPAKLDHRISGSVNVCQGDYTDPESLDAAYKGGGTLLMISGLNLGRRVGEHRNAIAAAKKAGIAQIVYTSVLGINPNNPALSAKDHYQTEADLRASGIPSVILRDALYAEIVTNFVIRAALPFGRFNMAAGDGRLSPVSKLDVVRCVTECVLRAGHYSGSVFEITGPEMLSLTDIARIASEYHDSQMLYDAVSPEERLAFFDSIGYPRTYDPDMPMSADGHMWASDELVSADMAIAQGYQGILTDHVKLLTGRNPERLSEVFARCGDKRYDEL